MTKTPYFKYDIDSLSFLARAEEQLQLFDEQENVSCLLYAALELRMGIESKLHESLDAASHSRERCTTSKKEYNAKKLLTELLKVRPDAKEESFVIFGREGSMKRMGLRFIPVTLKLAQMHGKIGRLLHFPMFNVTTEWYVKNPVDVESKDTLKSDRQLLGEVCEELKKCSSGDLILPMR